MNDKQQLAAMGEHMRGMKESEPRITKDARIGGVVFKAGVKVSTVINAAYRAAEFHQSNPKAFESLMDAISRQNYSVEFKVPDGWKLVPVEPTYGMAICGEEAWWGGETDSESIIMGYRAMLAAAPEYKP